ncbi:MAG TPA: ATP-binding protein [Anaerolineales bacterium]|nr:ATP-binding protein [Anaerolineales bacterium]
MFVDRQQELFFLNNLLDRQHPGPAQMVLLYGRRRVGKTSLLLHWTTQAGIPATYWSAEKEPAALQRRKLYAALLNMPVNRAPIFESWADVWNAAAELISEQKRILILDELPYAAEADPAMLSALQHAWDHHFKNSNLILVLCGSQIHTMETLLSHQSPLFGRMTGQWHLQPFTFSSLREFLPDWSVDERVAAYAIVGGVPAYLEWLDPNRNLTQNIREVMLSPGGMFVAEPTFLLYDEVREPNTYLAVIKAIGQGAHTLNDISKASLVGKAHLSSYLTRLQELYLVERRLPATIPIRGLRKSRMGRYHLSDPYFRFYFRFLAPFHDILTFDPERVLAQVKDGLRAFVGQTAFEQLSREWVIGQGRKGQLPFEPEVVGSHWSASVQVDVVAINWHEKQILLGECKWGLDGINRQIVRELIEQKMPKVMAGLPDGGTDWRVQYAIFSRGGITQAAFAELRKYSGISIDVEMLDRDLDT